ncbi:MAG: hypothetical protein SGARI_007299, partial [Bacillariaceae sp.]
MIVIGTARSVGVKVLYQLGFDHPLLVALLYLLGQSLALPVYWLTPSQSDDDGSGEEYAPVANTDHEEEEEVEMATVRMGDDVSDDDDEQEEAHHRKTLDRIQQSSSEIFATASLEADITTPKLQRPSLPSRPILRRQGSQTGLSQESHDAVSW